MKTLAVGSRVWGCPRPDSDFDIVVLVETPAEYDTLKKLDIIKQQKDEYKESEIIEGSFRAGPFNVIVVRTEWQFKQWEKGAAWMDVERRSNGLGYVTRERAVEILQALATGVPIPPRTTVTNRETTQEARDAQAAKNALGSDRQAFGDSPRG